MDWRFAWVSSFGIAINYDDRTSFTKEELAKSKIEYNFDFVESPVRRHPESASSIGMSLVLLTHGFGLGSRC